MAMNHIQRGEVLEYTNNGSSQINDGSVVVIGTKVGVALVNIPAGSMGVVAVNEVFALPKTSSLAISQGAAVYWNAAQGVATTSATGNTYAGYAAKAALASDTVVNVTLNR
jgi:predicted RecA/RadA family phage recombinase